MSCQQNRALQRLHVVYFYLSHCYSTAWDRSPASVCLCVCLSSLLRSHFWNRIWWNFAQLFWGFKTGQESSTCWSLTVSQRRRRKLRSSSLGVTIWQCLPLYNLQFLPNFTNSNALSMGWSKHCIVDTRWPIVVVNTSHDAPWRPQGSLTWKWHNPYVSPKLPKIVSSAITMGICLSNMTHNITVTTRDWGLVSMGHL